MNLWDMQGDKNHIEENKKFMNERDLNIDWAVDVREKATHAPARVENKASNLRCDGKNGSSRDLNAAHDKKAPLVMAPEVNQSIGVVRSLSESYEYWVGRQDDWIQIVVIINRIEYLAVIPVARKNIVTIIKLNGEYKHDSRIRSLE